MALPSQLRTHREAVRASHLPPGWSDRPQDLADEQLDPHVDPVAEDPHHQVDDLVRFAQAEVPGQQADVVVILTQAVGEALAATS